MSAEWTSADFRKLAEERLAKHRLKEWADAPMWYNQRDADVYHQTAIDLLVWVLEQCPPFGSTTS